MAKIFDLDRFTKRKRGKKPSGNAANPPDAQPPGVGKVLPINMAKGRGGSWPASSSNTSLHVGAAFLLVIGVLCGLYLSGSDKKPAIPKADQQISPDTTPQQPMPAAIPGQAVANRSGGWDATGKLDHGQRCCAQGRSDAAGSAFFAHSI